MKVLISFCNIIEEGVNNNLLLLDVESGDSKPLITFKDHNRAFTGIFITEDYIFTLHQEFPNVLYVLDRNNLKVIMKRTLIDCKDGHSIYIKNNDIYIVSTGNDRVLHYKFDRENKDIIFLGEIYRTEQANLEIDSNHLNSIFMLRNKLYITGFGLRKGEKWSSAVDGFVFDITNKKRLFGSVVQPHSLYIEKGNFYYCGSKDRLLMKNDKVLFKSPVGYLRGLAKFGDTFVVGTSAKRVISKSLHTKNEVTIEEITNPICKIEVYKLNRSKKIYEVIKEFDFSGIYQEIYDIVPYIV